MSIRSRSYEEHIKNREIQPPRILYYYTSLDIAREIIKNETLRFNSPLEFNDPFDAQWNIHWQLTTPEFQQAIVERILREDIDPKRYRDDSMRNWAVNNKRKYETLPAEQKGEHIERMAEEFGQGLVLPDQVSRFTGRLRILCLASTQESIQMWAYYASKHKGVVLAFDSEALERAWELPAKKVEYEEDFPKYLNPESFFEFFIFGEEFPQINIQLGVDALTLTKADKWGHENEWRYVTILDQTDNTQYLDLNFPVSALIGIVGGCNCDKSDFKILVAEAAAKNPQTIPYGIVPHPTQFDLVGVRLPIPT